MTAEHEKMSGRQRRQIRRLARIHGMRSVNQAVADVAGVRRRDVRKRGVTNYEAAMTIRSLGVGTSMAHLSGHDAHRRPWILGALVVALVAFVAAQFYWWAWFVVVLALLGTGYLCYLAVREFAETYLWRVSRGNRREKFGTTEEWENYDEVQ